jgi:hypothetical protein
MEQAGFPHLHEPYLLGELSENDRQAFEAHTLNCPECAEEVVTGSRFIEAARSVLRQRTQEFRAPVENREAVQRPEPWWRRWSIWRSGIRFAAIAALPLMAIVTYQTAVVIPGLNHRIERHDRPGVVAPVTLRPPTRGQAKVLELAPDQTDLILGVGLPPLDKGLSLSLTLQALAPGRSILNLTAAAPAAGEPLYLRIPTDGLTQGDYELRIVCQEQAGCASFEAAVYPFRVRRR